MCTVRQATGEVIVWMEQQPLGRVATKKMLLMEGRPKRQ